MLLHTNTVHTATKFSDFLYQSSSPFHCVRASEALLTREGNRLFPEEPWHLKEGCLYYVSLYDSALVAFRVGKTSTHPLVRMAAAHTDFPCFRIKPNPVINRKGYCTLNVEVYGGMNRSTWLDRPLGIAGKVTYRSAQGNRFDTALLESGPILTIPSLAIHMEPKTNDGLSLNPQKDMLPLFALSGDEPCTDEILTDYMSQELSIAPEDILSYDLTIYPTDPPVSLGWHGEFLSASRLDNMTSVYACLKGLLDAAPGNGIQLVALFDNEEVGSRTKQGAASMALPYILKRIFLALGYSEEEYLQSFADAFLYSVDVAHGYHPNYPEKNDITNFPILGNGVVVKTTASQAYAGDAEAVAMTRLLLEDNDIPWQRYVNRSDIRGGSTLGSLLSANLPIRTMDVGVPVLAMHSARELMAHIDEDSLIQLMTSYFNTL